MKNKKSNKNHFEIIYDPYRLDEKDTIDDLYNRYLQNSERTLYIDDTVYYKAMQIIKTTLKERCLIAVLSNEMNLKIHDTLIDDNDNVFIVNGFVMIRFSFAEIPEWYMQMAHVSLLGESYDNVGKYFSVIKQ